jgi:signal peptidase I
VEVQNSSEVQAQELPGPQSNSAGKSLLREILETLVLTVVIFVLVNLVTGRFKIFGSSMDNTFQQGEYIIVNRLAYKFGEPHRGDVVVLVPPGSTTNGFVERILGLPGETDYIKRILGVPGDKITIANGQLVINGQSLEEPYIKEPMRNFGYEGQVWTLGPDQYFVLGDNRNASKDSRDPSVGPITVDRIVGQVWAVYWPIPAWKLVEHYRYPALSP